MCKINIKKNIIIFPSVTTTHTKTSSDSEVNDDQKLRYAPPPPTSSSNDFTDSKEFSEAECDRDRALDLEVQRVMEKSLNAEREELTSLLAR